MLADGRLHLSAIARLSPHLREDNCEALLARAAHRSKREIDLLLAEIAPKPDAPSLMRRLPADHAVASGHDRTDAGGQLRPDGAIPTTVGDRSAPTAASAAPEIASTRSSSRPAPSSTRRSAGRRRCCGIRSRMAISLQSLTGR
jgi:hypothetical protein